LGWSLLALGLIIAGIGLVCLLVPSVPWLGRLPGGIRIEGDIFASTVPWRLPAAEPAVVIALMAHPAVPGIMRNRMNPPDSTRPEARAWIARAFTASEDIVYIGLGLLLAGSALALLVKGAIEFEQTVVEWKVVQTVVDGKVVEGKHEFIDLLDRILLILLIVELLYTVQVSFREHALIPEPFLLVGLISAIRRVLVLTAKFPELHERTASISQQFTIELAVLTVLILALAISLVLMRKWGTPVIAKRV
jgi:uncharacterized membrane protein (DUF373 family)